VISGDYIVFRGVYRVFSGDYIVFRGVCRVLVVFIECLEVCVGC